MSGWTDFDAALNFVAGVAVGAQEYSDVHYRETVYGPARGFVYFAVIGDPYITHVKIGFTSKGPGTRLKNLQTGCPFKITMLGFVFGCEGRERELHDVLMDYRCEGEWFRWTEYVEKIVRDQLDAEAI